MTITQRVTVPDRHGVVVSNKYGRNKIDRNPQQPYRCLFIGMLYFRMGLRQLGRCRRMNQRYQLVVNGVDTEPPCKCYLILATQHPLCRMS